MTKIGLTELKAVSFHFEMKYLKAYALCWQANSSTVISSYANKPGYGKRNHGDA